MSVLPEFVIEANDKISAPKNVQNEWNAPNALPSIFGSKENPDSGKRIAFVLPIDNPEDLVTVGKKKDGSVKTEIRVLNELRRKLDAAGASFTVDDEKFPVTVKKEFTIREEKSGKTVRTVADVKVWLTARQERPRKATTNDASVVAEETVAA